MHKNNRQEFVFADNRAETLQTKRLQQLMHRPSALVMQPKWMDNGSVYLQWEPITEEGVVWFYNRRTGLMFYIVQGSHTEYLPTAGEENAKSREEWVRLYGSDPLQGEDASIIEGVPTTPCVVELGAGEGRFSKHFKRKFAPHEYYQATDVAEEEGPTHFLALAEEAGIDRRFGVDANLVHRQFPPGSVARFVAANPYGDREHPGASFGLMCYGAAHFPRIPDARFLASAGQVLVPGGEIVFYGRTNLFRNTKIHRLEVQHKKPGLSHDEKSKINTKKSAVIASEPKINENPFLNIQPAVLSKLAKDKGYRVIVKRAKQPCKVGKGGNPDTLEKDKEAPHKGDRAKNGLQPYNTRISFILDKDFQSDDEHPRLTADSDEASDWEGDDMEDGYTRGDAGMDGSMEIHPLDYPGRYLGATAAGIQEEIDRMELNGLLTLQQANYYRDFLNERVEALIDWAMNQIAQNPHLLERIMQNASEEMETIISSIYVHLQGHEQIQEGP